MQITLPVVEDAVAIKTANVTIFKRYPVVKAWHIGFGITEMILANQCSLVAGSLQ